MWKKYVPGIVIFMFIIAHLGLAQENIDILVWLFKGIPMEGNVAPDNIEILSPITHSEISKLKLLIDKTDVEFKESLIDTLIEIMNLKTLDDLWLYKSSWEGSRAGLSRAIIKNKLAFRIDLYRIHLAIPQLALQAVIFKSRDGVVRELKSEKLSAEDAFLATRDESRLEKIVDLKLLVVIGEPTVVGIPHKDGVYYMTILATPEKKGFDASNRTKVERSRDAELFKAPQPVHMILPAYPEDLRQKGVKGDVGLRVTIDETGKVESVDLRESLHPYLNYSAVQAVLQWTFEPVVRKNEPVRAAFDYPIRFDPRLYAEELGPAEEIIQGELQQILDGCAKYVRKLAEMGLYFTCEESIKETHYRLKPEISHWDMTSYKHREVMWKTDKAGGILIVGVQIMDPERTEINRYICDYQLTKIDGLVEERRILLRENGRKSSEWTKLLEEKRFRVLNPFLNSLRILDRDRRRRFGFRLLGEDKIRGKRVYIIEALARTGAESGVRSAKIWVDKENFQILRSEIRGVPFEGYDDVLTDSVALNILPEFVTIHEYKIEKNGVLYPERTSVKVEYPRPGRNILKHKSELTYGKYKFFSVETQHEIIK